jgi:glycopeptide antibiotics resistance protein
MKKILLKFNKKSIMKILFYTYILLIFIFIVFKFNGSFNEILDRIDSIKSNREMGILNLNLTPFKQINDYKKNIFNLFAIKNIFGNIIAFLPFGFFIPTIYNKNFINTLIISLISILIIETLQFITMLGYFDIDDIILNTTGCLIGYFIYKMIYK